MANVTKIVSGKSPYDFIAIYDDRTTSGIIINSDGMPSRQIGNSHIWEDFPLAAFSPAQQAEIQRLAEWRSKPHSVRVEIVNKRLASTIPASLERTL